MMNDRRARITHSRPLEDLYATHHSSSTAVLVGSLLDILLSCTPIVLFSLSQFEEIGARHDSEGS
jgi:hypothetical protein